MTDYIKREDAKKWLTNLRDDCGRYQDMWHYAEALDQIIELLSEDVAPVRHGRWIFNGEGMSLTCSDCGVKYNIDDADGGLDFLEHAHYCITCGAKMYEEEDNA